MNNYTAHGYLAADPELRRFDDGSAVVNFAVGVSKKWKDRSTGDIKERTDWPRFVANGRQAEVIAEYFKKGSEILITASEYRQRSYLKDDQTCYVTEFYIKPGGFEFCGKSSGGGQRAQSGQAAYAGNAAPASGNYDDVPY